MANKQTKLDRDSCDWRQVTYDRKIYIPFCWVSRTKILLSAKLGRIRYFFSENTYLRKAATNTPVTSTLFIVIATTKNKKSKPVDLFIPTQPHSGIA